METGEKDAVQTHNDLSYDIAGTSPEMLLHNKERNQDIHVNILYSAHGRAEDLKKFPEEFQKADIFMPEVFGFNAKTVAVYKAVAEGSLLPNDALRQIGYPENEGLYDVLKRMLDTIYNSKKEIVFADVPQDDPLVEDYDYNLLKLLTIARTFGLGGSDYSFEEILQRYKISLIDDVRFDQKREDYIAQEILRMTKEMQSNPHVQNKSNLNVLIFLGAIHTPVFHQLQQQMPHATRILSETIVYDNAEEVLRRIRFSKEVTNEHLARALLSSAFSVMISEDNPPLQLNLPTITYNEMTRKIASQFSAEEIEALYEQTQQEGSLDVHLDAALRKKGLFLPDTPEKARQFITSYMSR